MIKKQSAKSENENISVRKRNHGWRAHKFTPKFYMKNGKRWGLFIGKVSVKNISSGSMTSMSLGLWFYNDGGRDWISAKDVKHYLRDA